MVGSPKWPFALILAALLAGCADDPGPAPAGPDGPDPLTSWTVVNDIAHCVEQVVVLLIDMQKAQAALPEGIEADDASTLLGLPRPTGKSAAFFNAVQCADGSSGELGVPIKPPTMTNATLPAVDYSLYQLGYVHSNGSLVGALADLGFPAFSGEATSQATVTAVGGTGRSTVGGADAMSYSFEAALGPDEPFPGTARFWRLVDHGIIHLEYDFEAMARKGTLQSCTIAVGSLLHDLTGLTDCRGQQAAAVAILDQSWSGSVRFTAGAHLAPPPSP